MKIPHILIAVHNTLVQNGGMPKSSMSIKGKVATSGDRAWTDDGVLYVIYDGPLTMQTIGSMISHCETLISQQGLDLVPFICTITSNITPQRFNFAHVGQILSTKIMKHLSVIIVIGAENIPSPLFQLALRFLVPSGHLIAAQTMAEAQTIANQHKDASTSIVGHLM